MNKDNIDYTEEQINQVWAKGFVVEGYDPRLYRRDAASAWMYRKAYGDRESGLGWEIDHIYPKSKGGDETLINLRPMNWHNNVSKGDDFPVYTADVISEKSSNIYKPTTCLVAQSIQNELKKLYSNDK